MSPQISGFPETTGPVVVLSAHLDDGVLSLGATMALAARSGVEVRLVTVLGGDAESTRTASRWDSRSGFFSLGEAAGARRSEDVRACAILGVQSIALPFGDLQYGRGASDDEIWGEILGAIGRSEIALIPGFPLTHPDHQWLTRLVLERGIPGARVGLYVEQPYAANRPRIRPAVPAEIASIAGRVSSWTGRAGDPGLRRLKRKASREYRSQLRWLSARPFVLWRTSRYERKHGGELLAWADRGQLEEEDR